MAVTPPPTGAFKAIASGALHACALRDTGELSCWGSNAYGQTNAPAGRYVHLTSGERHSCAIREDGVRTCWGAVP
jgi:alpha-tubulin suppressor-like RCC1 family protein